MCVKNLSIFLVLFHAVYISKIISSDLAVLRWSSSVFGSSLASPPLLVSHPLQGQPPSFFSLSVDGELSLLDLQNGDVLYPWPLYVSNDHFFARPLQYFHGGRKTEVLIIIFSQKGRIFYIDLSAIIVQTKQLPTLYLKKNWDFVHYRELWDIISVQTVSSTLWCELHPQIYTDATILDLSVDGVRNDVLIPVNFISKEEGSNNAIVSAIVTFNLASASVVDIHLVSISKKESEYPGYILADVHILRRKTYQVIVTLVSGLIFQLTWNPTLRKFETTPKNPVTYNQGPHDCQPTNYCSDPKAGLLENYSCCLYVDLYGHLAMMDLSKKRLMWEYNSAQMTLPTTPRIFLNIDHSPYAVFANNKGWIHCVSLLTGKSKTSFPLRISNDSFSSRAEVIYDASNKLYLILLSELGHLYLIPVDHPAQYSSVFHHPHIASHLAPVVLPSTAQSHLVILVQSKTGFIFRIDMAHFIPIQRDMVLTDINEPNPLEVGTLYGLGTSFSFKVRISDPSSIILKTVVRYYTVKVFINEYLYHSHKEPHSGKQDTMLMISVDLRNNTALVPPGVFLFGTTTVEVTDSMSGQVFAPDRFYIRINYDFQYELIWIVYLTFFICCTAILLFHFSDHNAKLHIPFYVSRDS